MKTKGKLFLIFILILNNCYLNATMIVSDPVSYTHYIEQMQEFKKQVDLMTKQVETLGGIKTATDDVKSQIYTIKEQFDSTMMSMMNATERLGQAVGNTGNVVKQLGSYKKSSITTSSSDGGIFYKNMAEMIDSFFETTGTMDAAKFFHLNDAQLRKGLRNDVQQMAYYKIVDDYDFLEASLVDTNKIVNEIMEKVFNDKEPSMIEMQKVTNMLLYNLIILQQQSLTLQNDMAFAMSLEKYNGIDHKTLKKRMEAMNDEDPERKQEYLDSLKVKTKNVDKIKNDYNINHMFGY